MAIRNLIAGGTDFLVGENVTTTDLNDTFDEIQRIVDNGN